eukprot:752938-Hanusia_phi.AAC.12
MITRMLNIFGLIGGKSKEWNEDRYCRVKQQNGRAVLLFLICLLLLVHLAESTGTSNATTPNQPVQYTLTILSTIPQQLSQIYQKQYIAYWGKYYGGLEFKLQVNASLQPTWTNATIDFGSPDGKTLPKQIPGMQWTGKTEENSGFWVRTLFYRPYQNHLLQVCLRLASTRVMIAC